MLNIINISQVHEVFNMRKSSHLKFYLPIILILLLLFGCSSNPAYSEYDTSSSIESTVAMTVDYPAPTSVPDDFLFSAKPAPTLLLLLTPSPPPTPTPAIQRTVPENEPALADGTDDVIVYITKTGECYHRGSCRYLHSSKIPILKSKAIALGYRPCKVCKP